MKYEDLNRLWQEQRRKDQEWHHNLVRTSVSLRDSVFALLAPPHETWQEFNSKMPQRYVEVVHFYGLDKPKRGHIGELSAATGGILIFGIGITFDNGLDSYPKNDIYVPVASKFITGSPLYSFFDRDKDAPDGDWTMGADSFAGKVLKRYKDYLSHDPNQGFETRAKFGFVQ